MLELTPSLKTPVVFYAFKRFKKAELLMNLLFRLSPLTMHTLNGLVFDYMEGAESLGEYIYPSFVRNTTLATTGAAEEVALSRAFKELNELNLIDIVKKKRRVSFRLTPLYFVLFDICSCFNVDKDSSLFISTLKEILKDIRTPPLSVEEAILLFQPLFNTDDSLLLRGRLFMSMSLLAGDVPQKKLLKRK